MLKFFYMIIPIGKTGNSPRSFSKVLGCYRVTFVDKLRFSIGSKTKKYTADDRM